jgi:hypothetical protein
MVELWHEQGMRWSMINSWKIKQIVDIVMMFRILIKIRNPKSLFFKKKLFKNPKNVWLVLAKSN